MLFNSYIFIFLFLPIVLLGWYGLNRISAYKLAMIFLSGMSLWFYAFFNPAYLWIIVASLGFNYTLSYIMKYCNTRISNSLGLLFGVFFNIGLLFYFKYYDFFVENINSIFKTDFALKHILLPLGISFFTFQQLSYIIDRYKKEAEHIDLIEYIAYVTFFPQLVAGPIVLHSEVIPQFKDVTKKKFNIDNFTKGIAIFTIGLAKKVLLADMLGNVANFGFDNCIYFDSISTYIIGLFYIFELYFDFSGYSDMAIGLGRMFNINLPQNFDSPLKSYSIKQTWRRWHMTLSRFFSLYVYIPLGGNRKGKIRMNINVLIVFALSGLWHGAAWTFVIWGVIQGIAIVWDNLNLIGVKGVEKQDPKFAIPKFLGQFVSFNYFMLSFIIFRANNVSDAFLMIKNIFSFRYTGSIKRLYTCIDIPELYVVRQAINIFRPQFMNIYSLIVIILMLIISIFIISRKNTLELIDGSNELTRKHFVCLGFVFMWAVISFSQVSTFIYFNF